MNIDGQVAGFRASTTTPNIQQQIAGLISGGQYTFSRVGEGRLRHSEGSIAIVDNAYATYLTGPSQVMLSTSWQRFKIAAGR